MATKTKLHPRNLHSEGYDFARLMAQTPELEAFTISNPLGQPTIDFQDVAAVRMLNRALLKTHYNIEFWDIPAGYLCPPIPGRVDYIHYLADLLAESNNHQIPRGRQIKALDIGTGASLVYPLTGQSEYGWHFTGVDIVRSEQPDQAVLVGIAAGLVARSADRIAAMMSASSALR